MIFNFFKPRKKLIGGSIDNNGVMINYYIRFPSEFGIAILKFKHFIQRYKITVEYNSWGKYNLLGRLCSISFTLTEINVLRNNLKGFLTFYYNDDMLIWCPKKKKHIRQLMYISSNWKRNDKRNL